MQVVAAARRGKVREHVRACRATLPTGRAALLLRQDRVREASYRPLLSFQYINRQRRPVEISRRSSLLSGKRPTWSISTSSADRLCPGASVPGANYFPHEPIAFCCFALAKPRTRPRTVLEARRYPVKSCCGRGSTKDRKNRTGSGETRSGKDDYLSSKVVVPVFLALVVVIGLLYFGRGGGLPGGGPQTEAQAAVTPVVKGGDVVFPESAFADGKAQFFEHKTPAGKKVRYFVIKSSDGVIRAAFDACDVCWEAGKGYSQKGDFMVCRNCGRRFHTTKVNVVTGGCNPSALTRSVRDGNVVIPRQALDEGARFFR